MGSSLKDRLLETHSKIIVFVVNFYQEMKRFLKLFSCTKATDVDSASRLEYANFVQEQFKIAGEIEDLKVARKLQQEKEDAKLAMEIQYFECENLMSELQNLHPDDK